MAIEKPDAIIVGSGAGGGTAAQVLTARGWNVVVLEKGGPFAPEDFLPYDELHFNAHKALIPHIVDDPQMYASAAGDIRSERWWEVTAVGGSTMIWDGNFPRYTPEDFDFPAYNDDTPADADMPAWPWTYEEFRPYFERAEWDWRVSGDARQSPEHMRDGYQYPMPPLRPLASSALLMDLFGKAGMQPYFGARAVNSQWMDGRPACPFCGYNQFFGCAVNSRANSPNTVLGRALATGRCDLRPHHYVTRIDFDAKAGRVKGVFYVNEPGRPEYYLAAPRVFVSVQTIQSARLFLLSEIPDPNDMIGHYLTYHPKGDLSLTFPGRPVWDMGPAFQPRTAIGSLQLRGLYADVADGRKRKGGKFSVYDPYTCTPPIKLVKGAARGDVKSLWGKDLVSFLQELRSQGGVSFSFTGDAMSLHENRVELDVDTPARKAVRDPWGVPVAKTFYQHHQWDLDLSKRALDRAAAIMVDAGGEVRTFEPQKKENPGYGHVHGALRAGADPGKSVLDTNCQSHTVKGLYVLDAAFMPTAGASNPSLTLIANALRVCDKVEGP